MTDKRVLREDFIVPRCTKSCPAGVDVPRYIRAIRMGKFDEALAVIRERIPFPVVCADACFAPCEDACAYRQFGDPIAIRALKRAAVDKAGDSWKKNQKKNAPTGKKVVVIGAGPAGLTAAYYLAKAGHSVSVMDEFAKPGGMMRYAIPKYRLPEDRLDRDIREITDLGVEFKGDTLLGRDVSLSSLGQDFDAVCITVGAAAGTRIPLEGVEKRGFYWGLEFLKDTALGKPVDLGKKVVVIGGGNVAIDVALTAKRLGAEEVSIFCLESREEMPAHPWEIALAEEEGVFINNSWAPKKVLGNDKVAGLGLRRCVSVFDNACNFNPVYDDEITHRITADSIIAAIGQVPDLGFLKSCPEIQTSGNKVGVKEDLSTGTKGIFAAGDVVTGPSSIINAISQGRSLAESIDKFLGGSGDISEILAEPETEVTLSEQQPITPRQEIHHLKGWQRLGNFDQVEIGLNDTQIAQEASRCLECDARKFEVTVNTANCKECGYCAEVCAMQVFGPAANFNARGYRPMEMKSSDWCIGCLKCFFSCPDFAIDVRERTA